MEAFHSKNQQNLGISPNRGGVVKKSKSPKFSWEKFKIRGGPHISKKSQVSEGTKD